MVAPLPCAADYCLIVVVVVVVVVVIEFYLFTCIFLLKLCFL